MITKEICEKNKCPLVPPNCGMFFLTPADMNKIAMSEEHLSDMLWFSPFVHHRRSAMSWSHDESFPIRVCEARGGMRKIVAAMALICWRDIMNTAKYESSGSLLKFSGSIRAENEWSKWANDPDEEDDEDEDDENMPIVFKEEK